MNPPLAVNQPVPGEPRHLERIVDDFEAAWQSGTPPSLEQFLFPIPAGAAPADSSARRELLEELVKIDLEYRWRRTAAGKASTHAGESREPTSPDNRPKGPCLEEYVGRYPELGSLQQLPLALIAEEYRVRQQWGDRPGEEEYRARFPNHDGKLLHEALAQVDAEIAPVPPTLPGPFPLRPAQRGRGTAAEGLPVVAGYEILEELGRGGMGVVYKAQQKSLDRLVALKMIRTAELAGSEERARFRSEAEAAARLQHPNIVQIYEVGEQAGMPYFSLEYVEGGTLAQQLAGRPQPARIAAPLLETLARAMHYAHQQGIVHRDLKPANILLQRKSEIRNPKSESALASDFGFRISDFDPKITDFGLAKRLDKQLGQTQTGMIMGTPSYMAAEQAEGKAREIGPATDVYGLGAILYEMVTGRPPFTGETPLDTLQQVMYAEPVSPMQLQPKVPRDLQTICLKCLQKAPADRYASALDLAEELRRFRSGEPIRARPASAVERILKWARRRPAVAALLLVSSLAAVSLMLGVFWHNRQLVHERARATAIFQQARDVVDEMLWEVGDKQIKPVPQMQSEWHALLERARRFYQLAEQFPNEPTYRQDRAKIYWSLGHIFREIGPPDQAEASYQKALAFTEQLVREQPTNAAYERDLAMSHLYLGVFYGMTRRSDQAENHLHKALASWEELCRAHPDVADYENELAKSRTNLGNLYRETNRLEEAETAYRKGLEAFERLASTHPEVPLFQNELAAGYNNLGYLLHATQRLAEAKALYRKALDIREHLIHDDPKMFEVAVALGQGYVNMANLVRDMEGPQESLEWYARALRTLEAQLQQKPRHMVAREGLRNAYWGRGDALTRLARHAEALDDWERALAAADGSGRVALQCLRAASLARLGEHARAIAEVRALADSPKAEGEILYELASVYALAVGAVRQDAQLTTIQREQQAERYASRAVELLGKAEAAGLFENPTIVQQVQKDANLAPISARQDFQKWLAGLQAKGKRPG